MINIMLPSTQIALVNKRYSMPKFLDDVLQLPGRNKLNIYVLLIVKLSSRHFELHQDKLIIKSIVSEVKILFHNHEQQLASLIFILRQNLNEHQNISSRLQQAIVDIINSLEDVRLQEHFSKDVVNNEDLSCKVGRFFESHVAVNMLLNPAPDTMACVKTVSTNIIKFIRMNYDKRKFKNFLDNLGPDDESLEAPNVPFAFGRFARKPSIDDVMDVLVEHKNLARIMLIHFMFMRDVYSSYKSDAVREEPVTKFGYGGDLGKFLLSDTQSRPALGMFLLNHSVFAAHLYKERGRGVFNLKLSNQLGICISTDDRNEFPSMDTAWYPDCICQEAKLHSTYLHFFIKHDIPYVAGSSGMTSVLSSAMLLFGQFETHKEHHHYILAIMAFITGGGLHSIHEVLTVPHIRLGLLESYRPFGDKPGNYNEFFNLFRYDDVVQGNIQNAWSKTMEWMRARYPALAVMELPEAPVATPETSTCSCTLF